MRRKQVKRNRDGLLANFCYTLKWKRTTSVLSVFVLVGTLSSLMMPAITLRQHACGMDEHRHETDCYIVSTEKLLSCGYEVLGVHHHTLDCFDTEGNPVCNQADFAVHIHDGSCFNADGRLVCPLKETAEHQHEDGCYQISETVIDKGHIHMDDCYKQLRSESSVCGVDDSAEHTHTDACYDWTERELICTEEEREPVVEAGESVLICKSPRLYFTRTRIPVTNITNRGSPLR